MQILTLLFPACTGSPATDSTTEATDSAVEADTDADADSDTDGDADTDADSDGDTDTDTGPTPDWSRVDSSGGVVERSVDVAVDPNGVVYAVWVDDAEDAWIRRSVDGTLTWEEPVRVDGNREAPGVTMARRPYVAADGDRVAVAFEDLDDMLVYVYVSGAGNLAFEQLAVLGSTATANDFPKPLFVSGDLAVVWQTYTPTGWMALARESSGWVTEPVDDAIPGVPCECCPNDARVAPSGDIVVAFRNNDDDIREHWVSFLPSGESAEVSDTEGVLRTCPMEGPRLGEAGGDLLTVWSDASEDGRTWIASSPDGGNWSAEREVMGRTGTRAPTVATGASGNVFVTSEVGAGTMLAGSADGGRTFDDPIDLTSSSGALGYGQLDAGGGVTVVGGTATDGTAWVYRVE